MKQKQIHKKTATINQLKAICYLLTIDNTWEKTLPKLIIRQLYFTLWLNVVNMFIVVKGISF